MRKLQATAIILLNGSYVPAQVPSKYLYQCPWEKLSVAMRISVECVALSEPFLSLPPMLTWGKKNMSGEGKSSVLWNAGFWA